MWSSLCRYLLAQGSPESETSGDEDCDPYEGEVSGWLVMADVVQGKLVAKSRVSSTQGRPCDYPFAVMCGPHAEAVILHPCTQVENLHSLTQAGFAVQKPSKGLEMLGQNLHRKVMS